MSEIRVENIIGETGTDAVKFAAGKLVKLAPLPLNEVAVVTPVTLIPLVNLTASVPGSPTIFSTLISDIF